jgi:hypothetical protein
MERGGPDHGALEREQGQLPESSLELVSISNQPHISNEVSVPADSQPESMLEESGLAAEENGGPSILSNSEGSKKRTGFAFDIPRSESRREDSLRLNPQPNGDRSPTPTPLDSQSQEASEDPEQNPPPIPPKSTLRKSRSFDYSPQLRIPPRSSRRSLRSVQVQLPASIAEEELRQEEEMATQTAEDELTHEEMGLEIALSFAVSGLQVSRFTPMANVEAAFRGAVARAPRSTVPESSGEWLAGGFGGMPEGAYSRAGRNGNRDSRGSGTGEIIRDEHSIGADDGDRNRNREEDRGPIASAEATAEPVEQARSRPKKSFLAKVKRLFRRRNQDVS